MGGASAVMSFSDPPFDVPINGHVSGNGKVKHREFAMASGEMGEAKFTAFLTTFCSALAADAFLGSGTTLLAAERAGRVCYGIELDPLYVDLIVRRWEKMTGRVATLESDGRSFTELAAARTHAAAEPRRPVIRQRHRPATLAA